MVRNFCKFQSVFVRENLYQVIIFFSVLFSILARVGQLLINDFEASLS